MQTLTQVLQLDVAQDVEAALLEVIDKVDEAGAAPWVLHHQQHLWAPELDVVFPHIQHQQVLPHLEGGRAAGQEPSFFQQTTPWGCQPRGHTTQDGAATGTPAWGHQFSPPRGTAEEGRAHLVEDEGLADVAPGAAGREVVEGKEEDEEEAQTCRG